MNAMPHVTSAALACMLAVPAQAFNPQPDPPARIGSISLAQGQTVRVNVRVARASPIGAGDSRTGPCRVSLGFVDGAGRGLGQTTVVLLRQSQASRLDLIGDEVSGASSPLSVHPVVRVLPAVQRGSPNASSCAVSVTAEVIDAAGHVRAVVADPVLVTQDSDEQ